MGQTQLFDARTDKPFTAKYDPNAVRLWCGSVVPGGEVSVIATDVWDDSKSLTVFFRQSGVFKATGTVEDVDSFQIVESKDRIEIKVKRAAPDTGQTIEICTYHVTPVNTLRKDGCSTG